MTGGAEEWQSIYDTLDYVLAFYNFCTGLVATGLNVFVVYALVIRRGISRVHGADMFVIGLTVTDLMTGISLIASILVVFTDPGRYFCLGQICFFQSTILCSALFVTLMTSDRYFKIVFPFLYQRVCNVDMYPLAITSTVYFTAFLVGFLPFMGVGQATDITHEDWLLCSYLAIIHSKFRIPYLVVMFVPIITAVLFYTKIFLVARHHIRNIAKTQGKTTRVPRGRYMKMIFIMAGLYFIFYIPAAVTSLVHDFSSNFNLDPIQIKTLFHFCSIGFISNTIVNPIIYAYTLPIVQNTFRHILGLPTELESTVTSIKMNSLVGPGVQDSITRKKVMPTLWSDETKKHRRKKHKQKPTKSKDKKRADKKRTKKDGKNKKKRKRAKTKTKKINAVSDHSLHSRQNSSYMTVKSYLRDDEDWNEYKSRTPGSATPEGFTENGQYKTDSIRSEISRRKSGGQEEDRSDERKRQQKRGKRQESGSRSRKSKVGKVVSLREPVEDNLKTASPMSSKDTVSSKATSTGTWSSQVDNVAEVAEDPEFRERSNENC